MSVNFKYFDKEGFETIFNDDRIDFSKEYLKATTMHKPVEICLIEKDCIKPSVYSKRKTKRLI